MKQRTGISKNLLIALILMVGITAHATEWSSLKEMNVTEAVTSSSASDFTYTGGAESRNAAETLGKGKRHKKKSRKHKKRKPNKETEKTVEESAGE